MKRYSINDIFYINSSNGYGMFQGELVQLSNIDNSFHYHYLNYIEPNKGLFTNHELLKLSEYAFYDFIAKEKLIFLGNDISTIYDTLNKLNMPYHKGNQ